MVHLLLMNNNFSPSCILQQKTWEILLGENHKMRRKNGGKREKRQEEGQKTLHLRG